ncbi:MAG: BrnT family toxin [Aquificales bacterium]|nr:BrnT family toxin [Aquificales bacterium]
MDILKFTWDPQKDKVNQKKHGISFVESETVFYDDYARLIPDEDHSEKEARFFLLGLSLNLHLLIVCHCYRDQEQTIRIISARKANKNEQAQYNRFRYA